MIPPHLVKLLGEFDRGEISEGCLSYLLALYVVDRNSVHTCKSAQRCFVQCNPYRTASHPPKPCGYEL